MSTLSSNRLRSSSATNRWSAKTGENMGRTSLRTSSTLDTGWSKDANSHPLRFTASSIFQAKTCQSEHDLKRPDEKTSEETIHVEVNGNNENYYENAKNASLKNKADPFLRRDHRYLYDYPDLNVSQAMQAMQKLQKLKELQRKRDLTERYYSHEIRKLIGDYFITNPRVDMSQVKCANDRMKDANFLQPYYGDRSNSVAKSLEPCGTMTTITRLDCGCIQETTRPIFTTTRGRVQKKTCNQSQDQVLLKLTSSNPQEHLCSSMEQQSTKNEQQQYGQKLKKSRCGSSYGKTSVNVDRENVTDEHDHRGSRKKQEAHGKSHGNGSHFRKSSDTSTTSV